jgi:hypothetical protein
VTADPPPVRRAVPLLWITVGALVVAGAGWSWLRWGPSPGTSSPSPPGPSATCPAPTGPTGPAGSAAQAPDGGAVRVTESGFTQVDGVTVSIGAILRNTSAATAYRTRVSITIFDDRQQPVGDPQRKKDLQLEVPVLPPGQQVGVGAVGLVTEREDLSPTVVTRVAVELTAAQWWPPDTSALSTTSTAHLLRVEWNGPDRSDANVIYRANWPACHDAHPRGTVVVFRDATGTIVGGVIDGAQKMAYADPGACRPGSGEQYLYTRSARPAGTDDAKSQVFVYCDPAPADPATAAEILN